MLGQHLGPYMDESDIPPPPDGSGVVAAPGAPAAPADTPPPPPDGSGIVAAPEEAAPVAFDAAQTAVQANQLSPEDSAHLAALYQHGSAQQIAAFLQARGRHSDPAQLKTYLDARDAGKPVNHNLSYAGSPVADDGATMSGVRGAADSLTFGTAPKIAAAVKAVGQSMEGNGGFSGNYANNLDTNNAYTGMDIHNHPWARIAGQLGGGALLPTGLGGVAARAESAAIAAGHTLEEAHAIGLAAVRNQMATVGGGYGVAHGAGSADTLPDAVTGALVEGGLGAATGGVLGQFGAKAGQRASTVASGAQDAEDAAVKSATAQDAARIADQYNIKATPATVGGGGAHAVQMGIGNLPGGMTAVAKGVGAENAGVANAVHNIADSVGTVSTREGAGQAAIDGAQSYSKTSRTEGGQLYTQRDQLMGGDQAPVTLDDTKGALSDIAAKYPNSQTLAQLMQHPVIRKIAGVADDAAQPDGIPAELTLGEATDALSHVRGVSRQLAKNGTDPDSITSQVANVKNGLTSDVYRAAAAADQAAGREAGAPGSAVEAQQKADAFWADRKQALSGTLKAPITAGAKPTEMPAEKVYGQIDADTQQTGGNLARLRDTWFRLPPEARGTITATKIDDMGRSLPGAQDNTGQAWSFDRYLTNFNKMAPQARNIMFGQDAASQLADIAAYSSRLRDISKSRNFSNTAKNTISGALMMTVGTALWHGTPMDAVGAAALVPASYAAAAMFLKTPAMRQWTASALRTATVSDPVRAQSAGRALIARLPAIARAEPAIANEVLALHQKLMGLISSAPMNVAAANKPADGVLSTERQQGNQNTPAQGLQP